MPSRAVLGSTFAVSVLALAVACSSTSSGDGASGSSGTSGTSGTGGASSGTSGNSVNKCGSTAVSMCSAAVAQAYEDCVASACNAKYVECYGPDWRSGVFTGPCAPYITCINTCACDDTVCYGNCARPTAACTTCLAGSESCGATCAVPTCAAGGTSGAPSPVQ